MSQAAERLHTVDELPDIPECYELVNGELLMMMSPAGPAHGYLVMNLGGILRAHVEENHLGTVFGEQTGFILPPCDGKSNNTSLLKQGLYG
jgi:Uma2 family endonuclease